MLGAHYYRVQSEICSQMARTCPDAVLSKHLSVLAAEFLAAAEDPRDESLYDGSGPAEDTDTSSDRD